MHQARFEFRLLRPILESLRTDGIDIGSVLEKHGLPREFEQVRGSQQLSILDYFRIQKDIARDADDLTAHFSQRRLTLRTGHFLVRQLQQAETLIATMDSLVDHFNMMHGDAYNSVRRGRDRVALVINDKAFPYSFDGEPALFHFIGECLLIKVHTLLDSLSGGLAQAALRCVRIQRPPGPIEGTQSAFWSVPIHHNWETYELVYDHDLASRRFVRNTQVDLSPSGLFSRVIGHLEQHLSPAAPSLTERTLALIEDGYVLQGDVAERLGMSTATHRRKLLEAGQSFRALVQQTRLAQAEAMLRRGHSVAQVAGALDYSDIRAFNRAYKQLRGITPAAFARQCAPVSRPENAP
ncbi:MAG: helix-turn-helix transcriptional regulator [Pseudomonadota bacterium]